MKLFKCVLFFCKSDLNETSISHFNDFHSINHLAIYRAYTAHQNKAIHRLSKESKIFHKFSKYGLYSIHIVLYGLVLVWLI